MNILVADDSQHVREHLVEMISEIPGVQKIFEAVNGWEAIAVVLENRLDAVVLYIRMPNGNGLDVLDGISEFTSEITVIVMTAYPYPQYRKKCLEAGASYFFNKATEVEKVVDVLEELSRSKASAGNKKQCTSTMKRL